MGILANNTRDENLTHTVSFPSMSEEEFVAVLIFFCLLLATILLGNGLIFTAYMVNKRLRSLTNKLVLSLAGSDLLVGLVSIPCWIYIIVKSHRQESYSDTIYQAYITFDIFVGSASILQLTTMSLERCHAVLRPLQHRTLPSSSFCVLISIPWVYAGIIALLQPIQLYHKWEKVYTLLMATTCFFIPFVIIVTAYVSIFKRARATPRTESFTIRRRCSQRNSFRQEVRLSVTIALITGLFVMAWLPLFVLTIIATYFPSHLEKHYDLTYRLSMFAKWMHYSNSSFNPFLYAFRSSEMLRTFRYIISRILCGYFKPEPRANQLISRSRPGSLLSSSNRDCHVNENHNNNNSLKMNEQNRAVKRIQSLSLPVLYCSSV